MSAKKLANARRNVFLESPAKYGWRTDDAMTDPIRRRPTTYRACPKKSDSLAGSALSPSSMNSVFLAGVRMSLHMINESSQLRHGLAATGIVKKHARHQRRERF